MNTVTITGNTYPIREQLKALGGRWNAAATGWDIPAAKAETAKALLQGIPQPAGPVKGHFGLLHTMLGLAGTKLKRPKIAASTEAGEIVISLAGPNSKNAGAIYVKRSGEYVGKITPAGDVFFPCRDLPAATATAIGAALITFASDPVAAAKAYGQRTGNCCFCSLPLTKAESVTAGYGPICAGNYGLPWGD